MGEDKKTRFIDKMKIKRDADGEIAPVELVSPSLQIPIKLVPISYGETKSMDSFGLPLNMWSDEDRVFALNHILEVDGEEFGEMTLEDLDDLEAWTTEELFQTVALASGLARLFGLDDGTKKEIQNLIMKS